MEYEFLRINVFSCLTKANVYKQQLLGNINERLKNYMRASIVVILYYYTQVVLENNFLEAAAETSHQIFFS